MPATSAARSGARQSGRRLRPLIDGGRDEYYSGPATKSDPSAEYSTCYRRRDHGATRKRAAACHRHRSCRARWLLPRSSGSSEDGFIVHGTVRPGTSIAASGRGAFDRTVVIHELDLQDPAGYADLIAGLRPDELYNLAGISSVATSFLDPAAAWRTNAGAVEAMLEAVRKHSPGTRFYQSSSSEMFGSSQGGDLKPQRGLTAAASESLRSR